MRRFSVDPTSRPALPTFMITLIITQTEKKGKWDIALGVDKVVTELNEFVKMGVGKEREHKHGRSLRGARKRDAAISV
jgi:hypothetical protein